MTSQLEPKLTVKVFKDDYLFGISLVDDDGKRMTDSVISRKINKATGILEDRLDITIIPTIFSSANNTQEKRDYRAEDFFNWSYLKLNQFPVISVESIKLMFPSNTTLISYPTEWFKVNKDSGIVQMLPSAGQIPSFYTQDGTFLPEIILAKKMVPQMIEIEYTAGFEEGKIPININEAIGLLTVLDILPIVGDLVAGAGIASTSISIDGLSQSVQTTSSAMYGAYAARQEECKKRLADILVDLRNQYKGIVMVTT
jgi:hypothetical protein